MPESFWNGFYICLSVVGGFAVLSAIWMGLPWLFVLGLLLGFALVFLITGLLASWFWWIVAVLVIIALVRNTLSVERDMYKWTNGRPRNED